MDNVLYVIAERSILPGSGLAGDAVGFELGVGEDGTLAGILDGWGTIPPNFSS